MQSIRKRNFSGSKGRKFVKIFFPREDLVMMVREHDLAGNIRKPIKEAEARKVLLHIGDWNESPSDQWKVRASEQQKKLDDGDVFAFGRGVQNFESPTGGGLPECRGPTAAKSV